MIIDHLDNLELRDEDVEQYHNELGALQRLSTGLHFLNAQVQMVEAKMKEEIDTNKRVEMYINVRGLDGITRDLVVCAFHWYSVTACDYVKLVGWLGNARDVRKANKYLQCVLPEVYVWRNKVGAHFAEASPRNGDTSADLAKSVMPPLSFERDAFYVGSLTLNIASEDQESSSRQGMRWSLTHTHHQLSSRYWACPMKATSDIATPENSHPVKQ